ncbi:hypothetical protein CsatA_004835 [Cannabis sativa]
MDSLRTSAEGRHSEWKPPPQGWISCTTDVAIGRSHSAGAAIIQDHNGTILKILTFQTNHIEALPGETFAVCKGAELMAQLGYKNVVFQCDSSNVVAALKAKPAAVHTLHFNIQEFVKKFLALTGNLNMWEIHWIPRGCNDVAHAVARWANRNNSFGLIDLPNFDDFLQQVDADGRADSSISLG